MLESIFQTFLLLAYFDIALMSVTIANYAVSASYLGRETRLSRWRMERRKQKLVEKLRGLQEREPQIDEIKKEISDSETEEKRLSIKIFLLSWLGAVVLPSMFFLFSFTLAVLGMNSEILPYPPFMQQQLMISSLGILGTGVMILLYVIRTIDSAARRIPVPEFKVDLEGGVRSVKCKSKEKKIITFYVTNKGEDIAENLMIFVLFPPEFGVHENPPQEYVVHKQSITAEHPNYNAAIVKQDTIHIDTTLNLAILLTVPEKEDNYKIPIAIYERKIGAYKDKLVIEVVGSA